MNEYEIRNGQIVSPGKFEGEPAYLPYFWDIAGDGCADIIDFADDELIFILPIDNSDVAQFPELSADLGKYIAMSEFGNGFVTCEIVDQSQIDAWGKLP